MRETLAICGQEISDLIHVISKSVVNTESGKGSQSTVIRAMRGVQIFFFFFLKELCGITVTATFPKAGSEEVRTRGFLLS